MSKLPFGYKLEVMDFIEQDTEYTVKVELYIDSEPVAETSYAVKGPVIASASAALADALQQAKEYQENGE